MSLEEQKLELIHLLLETKEEYLLKKLKKVFEEDVDWANELSENQLASIQMGKKDIEENRVIPHNEAKERIKKHIQNKSD